MDNEKIVRKQRRRVRRECDNPDIDRSPDRPNGHWAETIPEEYWRNEMPPHWGK
ncbi:hypothetical protein [Corynebacterium freiburgense]|uniref:hypothetical protein n=1 Tax=Corynebacterium freiburgense TaxID=556548 RepID=UPI000415B836|nr:hypothetical protein [Corynebacterium freiburgense]